ncbi:uncharacterized protein LOC129769432 [Toxorhynchites rutilus septentrionalis]|uniref:uncharacterized protein LOC129769432 n=1 Tax=Toxorhynchites rutilus septentrionalis TaxID=329112 RepID=UPI0024799660|nr:uncharacterized protein LOC129769432 [Toxorhynchites rutilus septentrionalis]
MNMIKRLTYLLRFIVILNLPTWAHDVRPVDQNRTRIVEDEDDPQKAEEAMLKLHFALMAESRQGELSLQNETNMTTDMSREQFAHLVARINDEVSLLRRQALTLSKAYQVLQAKYRECGKKLSEEQAHSAAKCFLQETNEKALACSKQCDSTTAKPIHSESNIVGNKYYYFNYVQYPKYAGNQRPSVEPHYQQPYAFAGPAGSEPSPPKPTFVDPYDQDGRPAWYGQTPQRPEVRPLLSSSALDKKIATLEQLEKRLDDKTERWKQAFFDKHGLQKVEKLYTSAEVRMMFDQWLKLPKQW